MSNQPRMIQVAPIDLKNRILKILHREKRRSFNFSEEYYWQQTFNRMCDVLDLELYACVWTNQLTKVTGLYISSDDRESTCVAFVEPNLEALEKFFISYIDNTN